MRTWCDASGQDCQRIGKVLRGEVLLRADDIGQAIVSLGISVRIAGEYARTTDNASLASSTDARNRMGAFYTPDKVAEAMVSHAIRSVNENPLALEPCFGDCAFVRALLRGNVPKENVVGVELDPAACKLAAQTGLLLQDNIENADFFDLPTSARFDVVVGNPPYVRLRSMDATARAKAYAVSKDDPTVPFGEEASLWLPFVLKCIGHLRQGGALSLVLPYEVTYVRYARPLWPHLAASFASIEVARVHERVFPGLGQDVVLLTCSGRGGTCTDVAYGCYETVDDLVGGRSVLTGDVRVADIASGARAFKRIALTDSLKALLNEGDLVPAGAECTFHIGYVSGDKGFFSPSAETVARFGLPATSLMPTAASSRRLAGMSLMTSASPVRDVLWHPSDNLDEGERAYIKDGEQRGIASRYKCRVRTPWWRVPGVRIPDMLLSVFSDCPRLMVNDAGWTFSNSVLGAFLEEGLDATRFAASWYTVLTLLSIETEVHSLGGGVLVAVPREANAIRKLPTSCVTEANDALSTISKELEAGNMDAAYHAGDSLVAKTFGPDVVHEAWRAVELLRSWRR